MLLFFLKKIYLFFILFSLFLKQGQSGPCFEKLNWSGLIDNSSYHHYHFHLMSVFFYLGWGWTGNGCFPHALILLHMLLNSKQIHILHHWLTPLFLGLPVGFHLPTLISPISPNTSNTLSSVLFTHPSLPSTWVLNMSVTSSLLQTTIVLTIIPKERNNRVYD